MCAIEPVLRLAQTAAIKETMTNRYIWSAVIAANLVAFLTAGAAKTVEDVCIAGADDEGHGAAGGSCLQRADEHRGLGEELIGMSELSDYEAQRDAATDIAVQASDARDPVDAN